MRGESFSDQEVTSSVERKLDVGDATDGLDKIKEGVVSFAVVGSKKSSDSAILLGDAQGFSEDTVRYEST